VTAAEHWLVWPVWTLVGVQETLTEVMVGDTGGALLPPPPPQAEANSSGTPRKNALNKRRSLFVEFRNVWKVIVHSPMNLRDL
jgi:hypothetical protein